MTTLKSPSHLDPARIAVPLGAAAGIVGYLLLKSAFPALPGLLAAILSVGIFFAVFLPVWRFALRRENARREASLAQTRNSQIQETQRQIATMKKRNENA